MRRWKREIRIKQFLSEESEWDPECYRSDREKIVAVLRRQPEYRTGALTHDDEFERIVEDLAGSETVAEFDDYLDELYDWANENLIWIGGEFRSTLPSVD